MGNARLSARVAAQAKINLFLKVLEQDERGYHRLWTMFQRIDLADDIVVRVGTGERRVRVTGPQLPPAGLGPDGRNLAFRAAEEYAAHRRGEFPEDFSIEITKNIPVGSGLGGGSADAGGVLRALDALAPTRMKAEKLMELARSLGADVPFLTSELERAYGADYGDRISRAAPATALPATNLLLVVPSFAINTKEAYAWLDADRSVAGTESRKVHPESMEPAAPKSDWQSLCREGNDFEAVAEKRHPVLRQIRERLTAKGAIAARLTGSGSAVFGLFEGHAPSNAELGLEATVLRTRTSTRVVPVEIVK